MATNLKVAASALDIAIMFSNARIADERVLMGEEGGQGVLACMKRRRALANLDLPNDDDEGTEALSTERLRSQEGWVCVLGGAI